MFCDAAQFERWRWAIACGVVVVIGGVLRTLLERRTEHVGDRDKWQ